MSIEKHCKSEIEKYSKGHPSRRDADRITRLEHLVLYLAHKIDNIDNSLKFR